MFYYFDYVKTLVTVVVVVVVVLVVVVVVVVAVAVGPSQQSIMLGTTRVKEHLLIALMVPHHHHQTSRPTQPPPLNSVASSLYSFSALSSSSSTSFPSSSSLSPLSSSSFSADASKSGICDGFSRLFPDARHFLGDFDERQKRGFARITHLEYAILVFVDANAEIDPVWWGRNQSGMEGWDEGIRLVRSCMQGLILAVSAQNLCRSKLSRNAHSDRGKFLHTCMLMIIEALSA